MTTRHDPGCGWAWCENMDHTSADCGTDPENPNPDCEFAEWDCVNSCPLRPVIKPWNGYLGEPA